jgi:hypothetical protein
MEGGALRGADADARVLKRKNRPILLPSLTKRKEKRIKNVLCSTVIRNGSDSAHSTVGSSLTPSTH